VVARRRFLDEFNSIWLDCLNGDSRETGKLTPEGKPDPSVFSTEWNREGIRVGTAIGLFVKRGRAHEADASVRFRHFWGTAKRNELLASLDVKDFDVQYEIANPQKYNRWSFRRSDVATHYIKWPSICDLASRMPFAGIAEDRGKALIQMDRAALEDRMRLYFNKDVDWDSLRSLQTGLTKDVPRFDAKKCRQKILDTETFDPGRLLPFTMRPFDTQWCYYSPVRPLWREPRPDYWATYVPGQACLVSRLKAAKDPEGPPVAFTRQLCDYHMMPPNASVFPVTLRKQSNHALPGFASDQIVANLSVDARAYLTELDFSDLDTKTESGAVIWFHVLSISYAPLYLTENAEGIRHDWPRIPLPNVKNSLVASADLGRQVAALLDTEAPVPGVTTGKIRMN
jgi:hypothetical protein